MLVKNPLNRKHFIRINDGYDDQDVVIENALSQTKQFVDMPSTTQLTQNAWNRSPYTRANNYNDVTVTKTQLDFVRRDNRYNGLLDANKYHEHR